VDSVSGLSIVVVIVASTISRRHEMYDFLQETVQALADRGKTPDDVQWVGSKDGEYAISWDEFAVIAEDVHYDSDYGAQEVATDIVVVGKNWWMDRGEYDGSEWWDFHVKPTKKRGNTKSFTKVAGGMWDSIETHEAEFNQWVKDISPKEVDIRS
jgi:hypothetical protein